MVTMWSKAAVSVLAAGFLSAAAAAWSAEVSEPAGYRMEDYKAPVPATLRGATVVTTAEAEALWRGKRAVFLDVMPHTPKPANLPAGTIWKEKVRNDIKDSIWLANVGYGALPDETTRYFADSLAELTGADKSKPVLFYCMTDCWMSWNAAKRAIEWGYSAVYWYPPGADGWEAEGLPVEEKTPHLTKD